MSSVGNRVSENEDWRRLRGCAGADSRWFFPPTEDDLPPPSMAYRRRHDGTRTRTHARSNKLIAQEFEKKAKSYCDDCPVKVACLDFALQHNEVGIWGGTNDRERRLVRRKVISRIRCPICLSSEVLTLRVHECLDCGASWAA